MTTIATNLTHVNYAGPSYGVTCVVAVNADGTPIAGGGGGGGAFNLTQVGGSSITLGQAAASASLPVVLASDQGSIPANFAQFGGTAVTLGAKASAASLPVVIASDQAVLASNVSQIGGAALTLGQKISSNSLPVAFASDQTAALQNISTVGGTNITLGQKASTASLPIVIASDQSPIAQLAFSPIAATGKNIAVTATSQDLAVTNVTSRNTVRLYNQDAAAFVYFRLGTSAGTAVVGDLCLGPGKEIIVSSSTFTHLSIIASAPCTVNYIEGSGGL